MPTKPIRRNRRLAMRCPKCADRGVKRETTVKGRAVVVSWRCNACKKVWVERRKTHKDD